jgi:hypothetical protein
VYVVCFVSGVVPEKLILVGANVSTPFNVIVCVPESKDPSLTLYVNESLPSYPLFAVYVND